MLLTAGHVPVPYSEELPDGHLTISHNVRVVPCIA